jgi:hypothetical protein
LSILNLHQRWLNQVTNNLKTDFVEEMLKDGKDPKDKLINYCTPHCKYWKDKLTRCEMKLEYYSHNIEKLLK